MKVGDACTLVAGGKLYPVKIVSYKPSRPIIQSGTRVGEDPAEVTLSAQEFVAGGGEEDKIIEKGGIEHPILIASAPATFTPNQASFRVFALVRPKQ